MVLRILGPYFFSLFFYDFVDILHEMERENRMCERFSKRGRDQEEGIGNGYPE